MNLKNISGLIVAIACIALTSCSKEDVTQEEVIEFETVTQPTETVTIEEVNTEEILNQNQNYYSVCTSKSKDEVESFAKQLVNYFEQEDWEGLSDIIRYPIMINETYYASKEAFLEKDWSNVFTQEYIESVVNAETTDLFCNWSGICFAEGLVWLGQTGDELYIDALNFYDETQKEEPSEGMLGHWVLDYEKTEKELKKHSSLQELLGTGIHAGSSLDFREDNQFSMGLAIVVGISGTYEIEEDVIKIHYSDERGNEGDDVISYVMIDEQQYIISNYAEEEMYWKKLAD